MTPQALPATAPPRLGGSAVAFGPFEFDPHQRLLRRDGVEIPLPPRVLAVLELLLGRAGEVVSRQEIIDTVWKDAFVTDTSLAEAVSFLRQALGDDPQSPAYVQTVHRRGYRFVSPITGVGVRPADVPVRQEPAIAEVEVLRPSIANELVPWSVAIVTTLLAISAVWYSSNVEPVAPPVARLAIDAGQGLRFDTRPPAVAISPGGGMIAWSACASGRCQLYTRPLDQLAVRPVPDTDGASAPFFSPDERWLGFFADGKLKKIALAGGAPQILTDASQPFGAAWMADGRIVFAASTAGGLMSVSENGGAAEVLTTPSADAGEIRHVFPSPVRDGDGLLFTVVTSPLDGAPGRLALLPYPSTRSGWRTIAEAADIGIAAGHEYIAFARGSELHAVAFDRVRQAAGGPERTVATSILSPHLAGAAGAFVAVTRERQTGGTEPSRWAWNAPGDSPIASGLEDLRHAKLSPDGARVAGVGLEPRPDIWWLDLHRGTKTRLTYGGPTAAPVWRADGTEVLFAIPGSSIWEIRARSASGSGEERRVLAVRGRHVFPASMSRSGDLAFTQSGGTTRTDVGLLRSGHSSPSMIVESPFDDVAPALSPDGSMLAYQTDESGRWEVVLVRLRDGRRSPVSSGGGVRPFWGSERILYFERGEDLMSVWIDSAGELAGGLTPVVRLDGAVPVGMTAGGRMLLHRTANPKSPAAVVTLQWVSELRAKLGPPTATSPR